jgi:hypothetical protein
MGQLSDLPIELIYHIIEKGCLMELHELSKATRNPHSRRRLAFASIVRGVCSSYRDIIDLSTDSDGQFWAAVLTLSFDTKTLDRSFPQQVMKFHRHLADSLGCSLLVSFRFSADERFKVPTRVYETEPADANFDIALRLFLHGLQMLLPYQRQLYGLRMEDSHPQVDKYIYELLCSLDAPRLTVLVLYDIWWYQPTGTTKGFYTPSLQAVRDFEATVPNFRPILRNNNRKSIRSNFSLEHLGNLQSLSMPSSGWLSEMALPPHISYLTVNISQEGCFDLRKLAAKPILCASLTNLDIWNDDTEWRSDAPSSRERRSFVQEHVSLPRLHTIWLSVLPENVMGYLMHMHLPRIEEASIVFHGREAVQPPTARIPQATSPLFTTLSRLYLSCDELCIALSVLSHLASPSVRDLNLWCQEDGSHLGPDCDEQFGDCLASIQPKKLKIGFKSLKLGFFILERLSRSKLTELSLKWNLRPEDNELPPAFTGRDPGSDGILKSIASSSLEKLTLTWVPSHLIHDILSSLDSHALESLTINLPPWQHEESLTSATSTQITHHDQRETPKVEHYFSVSKFCFSQLPLSITTTHLRQFLDLIPNAEHVTLDIGSDWAISGTTLLEGPSIYKPSFRKLWIPICEALQPDADGGFCPLLCLANLIVSFPLDSEGLEEPLSMFSRVFRARADIGALYLKLKAPEERHCNKGYGGDPDMNLVRLTFGYSGEE